MAHVLSVDNYWIFRENNFPDFEYVFGSNLSVGVGVGNSVVVADNLNHRSYAAAVVQGKTADPIACSLHCVRLLANDAGHN